MFKHLVIFILIWNVSIGSVQSQTLTIRGLVTSDSGEAMEGASVVLKVENRILGYTYTDEKGFYTLQTALSKDTVLILETTSLGFASSLLKLRLENQIWEYHQDIILSEQAESLNIVVLKTSEKISINRDTISFSLSAFKDQSEKTVEDMLKKLPGIEVAEDGSIRALGKPIQKILIENEDLAGINYKVISKNLDISVLEKIEIISNYDENPVLKQFLESENIVLNLKLKKNKKNIIFGQVKAGGGVLNKFLADLNLGLITPGLKYLDLANANNIGSTADAQFSSTISAPEGFNDFAKNFALDPQTLVSLMGITNELDSKNYIENSSFSNNFLVNKKFSNEFTLRNSLFFYDESFLQRYHNNIEYFIDPEFIVFSESNVFDQKNVNLTDNLKLTYTPSEHMHFTLDNKLIFENQKHLNFIKTNGQEIVQNLKNKRNSYDVHLQGSRKISSGAFLLDAYLGTHSIRQNFMIHPNTLFSPNEFSEVFIRSEDDIFLNYNGLEVTRITKKGKTSFALISGIRHEWESIKTNATSNANQSPGFIDSLSGRLTGKKFQYYLQSKIELEVFKNAFVFADGKSLFASYKKNDLSKNFFLPNFNVGFRISKTRTGSYRFQYSYVSEFPQLFYFTDFYYLQNYRSLIIGTSDVETLKSHKYTFNYTFSRIAKRLLFNFSATHYRFENQMSAIRHLSQNIDIGQRIYWPGLNLSVLNGGFTTYIDPIDISFKIGYQKQFTSQYQILNDLETELKSTFDQYYLRGTTYFKGALNFNFLFNMGINTAKNENIIVHNEYYKTQLKAVFRIHNSFTATIEGTGYFVSSEFYESTNANLEYRFKNNDWLLGLELLNLFNDKSYIFNNAMSYIQTSTIFEAVPRYVVIYGKLRI